MFAPGFACTYICVTIIMSLLVSLSAVGSEIMMPSEYRASSTIAPILTCSFFVSVFILTNCFGSVFCACLTMLSASFALL